MTAVIVPHSQDASIRNALRLLDRAVPPYWVAIDPPGDAAQRIRDAGSMLIVRHFWRYDFAQQAVHDEMIAGRSPQMAALEFVNACRQRGWYPFAAGVMTPPAMATAASPPDLLRWAIEFQSACVGLLGGDGKRCYVCNVPTGNDGYYVPGATYYACQEYGWPDVLSQAPWHALRHRDWFGNGVLLQNPSARLLIAECGVTQAVEGRADIGYRSGDGGETGLVQSLAEYQQEIEQDTYVEAVAYYGIGMNADWSTHDALGDTVVEDWLVGQWYISLMLQPQVQVKGGNPVATYQFRFGFLDKANELGRDVVGEPLADELYLGSDFSYQPTTKGELRYYKGPNVVHFFPAAQPPK